jgi:hypothetical protein
MAPTTGDPWEALLAQVDEAGKLLETLGGVVADYLKTLLARGMPAELAARMALDLHAALLDRGIPRNAPVDKRP